MSPACYVIQSADWNAAVASVAHAFLFAVVAVYLAGIDWWRLYDLWRFRSRRRRIRAIRQARAAL